MKLKALTVIPFSNATEAEWWKQKNCYHCAKYSDTVEIRTKAKCRLAYDLDFGFISGNIPLKTAIMIGWQDNELTKCKRIKEV